MPMRHILQSIAVEMSFSLSDQSNDPRHGSQQSHWHTSVTVPAMYYSLIKDVTGICAYSRTRVAFLIRHLAFRLRIATSNKPRITPLIEKTSRSQFAHSYLVLNHGDKTPTLQNQTALAFLNGVMTPN
jgi:hypothetical protein